MSRSRSIAESFAVQSRLFDHHGRVRRAASVEVEERLNLALDALDPAGDDLGVVELALGVLLGVADEAGRPADERERPVAGVLQPAQHEDLHQVAEVQARRGRIEAAVDRHRPGVESRSRSAARSVLTAISRARRSRRGRAGRRVWSRPESLRIASRPPSTGLPFGPEQRARGRSRPWARLRARTATASPRQLRRRRAGRTRPALDVAVTGAPGSPKPGRRHRFRSGRDSTPSATVSRAGPRARSRADAPPRRSAARSAPATTSPARSRTAEGQPAGPQTRFMQ